MKCQLCHTLTCVTYVDDDHKHLCENCKPMIVIKDKDTLTSVLCGFHPMLVNIIISILENFDRIVITCGFRAGDKGVHGTMPCRGIDIRSWVYTRPLRVVSFVNDRWQYDPERPSKKCAVLHDSGKGMHIHLQVHPNTEVR